MERIESSPAPAHASDLHPGRLWAIALGAAIVAALAAWGVEEASLHYYGPQMTAASAPADYRPDLRGQQPGEGGLGAPPPPQAGRRANSPYGASRAMRAYQEEFTAKAVALSGGAVGAMFGLAIGLALGLSGRGSTKSWVMGLVASIVGAALCGCIGWMATQALVPIFYKARADNPASTLVMVSLLLIRGIPRMVAGLAGGVALAVAAGGGRSRLVRGAVGGLVGAGLGVGLMVIGDEIVQLIVSESTIATSPILRSPARRVTAILAVTIPSAICATIAILGGKPQRKQTPADAALA